VCHENAVKHREIGGVYFHLKGGSGLSPRPRLKEPGLGPTKLSIALSAEGSHSGR